MFTFESALLSANNMCHSCFTYSSCYLVSLGLLIDGLLIVYKVLSCEYYSLKVIKHVDDF